jgi:RND family efflux transporter MFP subunit
VEIPESAISRLREGDIVQVQVDTLNRLVSGRVTRIIPSANPSSRSFTIKIALPTTSALMPGMFGRLQLPRSNSQGILIPTQALIRRGQLEGIYVVDANQQATLRWIKTGKRQGEQLEVTSGLVAGERVILSNLSELTDGQPIEIREQT